MSTDVGVLRPSEVESRRFGRSIARGVVSPGTAAEQVLEDILRIQPETAIFRCDAGDTAQVAALVAAGLTPLHADTLVYYRATLGGLSTLGKNIDPAIRTSHPDDESALAAIVRRSFADYRNHYHANPLLHPRAILEGYVEWALDYAIRPTANQETWVYHSDGQARSFATCRLEADRSQIEVVLNATDPAWAGRGFYTKLLGFMLARYESWGYGTLAISTQVWNYEAQRIWVRSGLTIDRAYDTYHVNLPSVDSGTQSP